MVTVRRGGLFSGLRRRLGSLFNSRPADGTQAALETGVVDGPGAHASAVGRASDEGTVPEAGRPTSGPFAPDTVEVVPGVPEPLGMTVPSSTAALPERTPPSIVAAFADVPTMSADRMPPSSAARPSEPVLAPCPVGIERRGDKYVVRGYAFSDLDQAKGFLRRKLAAEAMPTPGSGEALRNARVGEAHWGLAASTPIEGHPDIERKPDGKFVFRGYAFGSLDQAVWFKKRLASSTPEERLRGSTPPVPGPATSMKARVSARDHRREHPVEDGSHSVAPAASTSPVSTYSTATGTPRNQAPAERAPAPDRIDDDRRRPARNERPSFVTASARPPLTNAGQRWIAKPTPLQIGGDVVTTDLVYFGRRIHYSRNDHRSLIDPADAVAAAPAVEPPLHGWYASYDRMTPSERRAYLNWLDGGRADASVPAAYAMMFMTGLEHRLLQDDALDQVDAILDEAERLHAIYGRNEMFGRQTNRFLDVAYHLAGRPPRPVVPSPGLKSYDEVLPFGVRLHIGRLIGTGERLRAADALSWVVARQDTFLRTAARRCWDEFMALWPIRFAAAYPKGLKVKVPVSRIKASYMGADHAFTAEVVAADVPDVMNVTGVLGPLRALIDAITEELGPFSRAVGRDPAARGTLAADALLPKELRQNAASVRGARAKLEAMMASDDVRSVPLREIVAVLDLPASEPGAKVPAAMMERIGGMLDATDTGFEPDRRFGPCASPIGASELSLFQTGPDETIDPMRPDFTVVRAIVEAGALAATAGGPANLAATEYIGAGLAGRVDLSNAERMRLSAFAHRLTREPPASRSALKRYAALPDDARRGVADSAVAVILAGRRVGPAEVRFLEDLHAAVGLPAGGVYGALHRGGDDDGPVAVASAQRVVGVPIPPEIVRTKAKLALDPERLARLRAETSEVSAMLGGIFAEEEPLVAPVRAKPAAASWFAGLDARHAALLDALLEGPMTRAAFDARAGALKLLADGAVETLNDWGFDALGEAVIEDGEDVSVAEHLHAALMGMGTKV